MKRQKEHSTHIHCGCLVSITLMERALVFSDRTCSLQSSQKAKSSEVTLDWLIHQRRKPEEGTWGKPNASVIARVQIYWVTRLKHYSSGNALWHLELALPVCTYLFMMCLTINKHSITSCSINTATKIFRQNSPRSADTDLLTSDWLYRCTAISCQSNLTSHSNFAE